MKFNKYHAATKAIGLWISLSEGELVIYCGWSIFEIYWR